MIIREAGIKFITQFGNKAIERTIDRRWEIGIFSIFRPFIVKIDTIKIILFNRPCKYLGEFLLIFR